MPQTAFVLGKPCVRVISADSLGSLLEIITTDNFGHVCDYPPVILSVQYVSPNSYAVTYAERCEVK